MSTDREYNLTRLWLGASLVATLILCSSLTTCAMFSNQKVAEMVKGGADPIAARCAIKTGNSDDGLCAATLYPSGRAVKINAGAIDR